MASVAPSPFVRRVVDNLCARLSLLAPFPPDPIAFPSSATFAGEPCTLTAAFPDGPSAPFVLLARPESGVIALPLPIVDVDGAAAATLDVHDALFAYLDSPDPLTTDPTRLFAALRGWPAGRALDVEYVPAGGALFFVGTLEPAWLTPIAEALAFHPVLPVSGHIEFGGVCPRVTLGASVGAVPGVFEKAALELVTSRRPSRLGFELRLVGTITHAGLGDVLRTLGVAIDRVAFGIELGRDLSVRALTLDLELDRLDVPGGVLQLQQLAASVQLLDPGDMRLATASLSGYASLFGGDPLFAFRGRYPRSEFRLALLPGTQIDLPALLNQVGLGGAADVLPSLAVEDASGTFRAAPASLIATFVASCDGHLGPFAVRRLAFHLETVADGYVASFDTTVALGPIEFTASATYDATLQTWALEGSATTASTIAGLLSTLGLRDSTIPDFLRTIALDRLTMSRHGTLTKFACHLTIAGAELAVAIDMDDGTTARYEGRLTFPGGATFAVTFTDDPAEQRFSATAHHVDALGFARAIGLPLADPIAELLGRLSPQSATLTVSERDDRRALAATLNVDVVSIALFKSSASSQAAGGGKPASDADVLVACIGADVSLDLASLPIVGSHLTGIEFGLDHLDVVVSAKPLSKEDAAIVNAAAVPSMRRLPDAGLPSTATAYLRLRAGDTERELQLALGSASSATQEKPAGTAQSSASADRPQSAQPTQTTEAPRARGAWLDVQKQFGPVAMRRIGVASDDRQIWLLLDAAFILAGIDLELIGLGLAFELTLPPRPANASLRGLELSCSGPMSVSGGLVAIEPPAGQRVEYVGQLSLKAATFQLAAIGAYTTTADGRGAFFAFAVLDKPLGGPAAFYVLGVAAGFGCNRTLKMPAPAELPGFPLVQAMIADADHPARLTGNTDVRAALASLDKWLAVEEGESWVALGVHFTSFGLVESVALLSARFGGDVEIDVLGLSKVSHPRGASDPIAYAELALVSSYRPSEGVLSIVGQLTNASYLLRRDCHLTGGFAYCSWFEGEHAGDFVLTLGGYHPAFRRPAWYPDVPRLAAGWQDGNTSVRATLYFALTPSTVMAGGSLEVRWESGDLAAWFDAHVDFLLCWKPFHYEANVSVCVGASYRVDLWLTSYTVTVHLGIDVAFWGPPFGGIATIDLCVCTIRIPFGDSGRPAVQPIRWAEFKTSFLPPPKAGARTTTTVSDLSAPIWTETYCGTRLSSGMIKDQSGTAGGAIDWVVNPERLELVTISAIPIKLVSWTLGTGPRREITPDQTAFGVGPVDVADEDFTTSHHHVELHRVLTARDGKRDQDPTEDRCSLTCTPVLQNLPAATWKRDVAMSPDRLATANDHGGATVSGAVTGLRLTATPRTPLCTVAVETASLQWQDAGDAVSPAFAWSAAPAPAASAAPAFRDVFQNPAQATLDALTAHGLSVTKDITIAGLEQAARAGRFRPTVSPLGVKAA